MSGNTRCHLGKGEINGESCPQGNHFEVKQLIQSGGNTVCPNSSCPFIQSGVRKGTQVILVGKPGGPQKSIAINA